MSLSAALLPHSPRCSRTKGCQRALRPGPPNQICTASTDPRCVPQDQMLCLAMGRMVNQRKFQDPGPCPVGFWRTSALIRQILVLRYLVASRHTLQEASCRCHFTKCADRSVFCLLAAPHLVGVGMPRKLSWRSGPVISKRRLFCARTLRLNRRGSRGLGPLGPVESQVRVCGKTSAAARLISRDRAPRAEPEYTKVPALSYFSGPDSIRVVNSCASLDASAARVEGCLVGSASGVRSMQSVPGCVV